MHLIQKLKIELSNVSANYTVDNIGAIVNHGFLSLFDTSQGGVTITGGSISNSGVLYCEYFSGIGIYSENSDISNSGNMELVDYSLGTFDAFKNISQSTLANSGVIEIRKGM